MRVTAYREEMQEAHTAELQSIEEEAAKKLEQVNQELTITAAAEAKVKVRAHLLQTRTKPAVSKASLLSDIV